MWSLFWPWEIFVHCTVNARIFSGKSNVFQKKLSTAIKFLKWVPLTPALSRLSQGSFKFGFDELGGSYDLIGIEARSCSYSESKFWPRKPLDLSSQHLSPVGAKARAPMQCSEIKLMLLTDDSRKSNLVLFLFPCGWTEILSFSIICRVVVSLYGTITIMLNFLYFLGIWKCHWESKAVPSIEPCLVLQFSVHFSKPCYKERLIVNVQHYSHGSHRASYHPEEDLASVPTDMVSAV